MSVAYFAELLVVAAVATAVAFALSVAIHEGGHLVAGRLTGYRLVTFRLFSWVWSRREGRWTVARSSQKGMPIIGQCLMDPPHDEARFRYRFYNAGGWLANLVLGGLAVGALAGCFRVMSHVPDWLLLPLAELALMNLFSGVANALPLSPGMPTDGANARSAGRSADCRHAFYLQLRVNAETARGASLAELPAELFEQAPTADLREPLVAAHHLLRGGRLSELGDHAAYRRALQDIDLAAMPQLVAAGVRAELAFLDLVDAGDAAAARSALEDPAVQKYLKIKQPGMYRVRAAAAFFLDHDVTAARGLLAEARQTLPAMANPGMEKTELSDIDRLEAAINAALPAA